MVQWPCDLSVVLLIDTSASFEHWTASFFFFVVVLLQFFALSVSFPKGGSTEVLGGLGITRILLVYYPGFEVLLLVLSCCQH